MKAVYNQLNVWPDWRAGDHTHPDGTLHDMPDNNPPPGGSTKRTSNRNDRSPTGQTFIGGGSGGGRAPQSGQVQQNQNMGTLTPGDLPDHPTDYIAGLIPDYSDVELDYFGLAQEASDYNLPKIDENLTRAVEVAGPLAKQLTRSNTESYQTTMEALLPGTQGLINASTRRAQQNLSGRIGSETESAILRGGARRALQSGVGFGSGRSSNLTARDLGLFSEDLQNTGFAQAQQMYAQAATNAQNLMVRQSDLASNLQAQYNQGSLLTPGQAIEGESANITSKFNISQQQIANAQNAYKAKYQKTSDTIAYQEAQATREYQAAQARKERKSSLFSTIISGVAGIAANAVLPGSGVIVGSLLKGATGSSGAPSQGAGAWPGSGGGYQTQRIELVNPQLKAQNFAATGKHFGPERAYQANNIGAY
mgnify:CR=1 FL=1